MTGARAKMMVLDANTKLYKPVGIFSNVSYGIVYGVEPAYILGRMSAASIDYTHQDVVAITAEGWRVVNHSWFVDGHFPTLAAALTSDYLSMAIFDQVTGAKIMHVNGLRSVSATTSLAPKVLGSISMHFLGLTISDESVPDNVENALSMSLPL